MMGKKKQFANNTSCYKAYYSVVRQGWVTDKVTNFIYIYSHTHTHTHIKEVMLFKWHFRDKNILDKNQ